MTAYYFYSLFVLVSLCSFLNFLYLSSVIVNTSGASTLSMSGDLCYAPLLMDVYLRDYKDLRDTDRPAAIPWSEESETIYDSRNGFDRNTAPGA